MIPGNCATHPLFALHNFVGRPLNNLHLCAAGSLVSKALIYTRLVRLVAICLLSMVGTALYSWFRTNNLLRFDAFALAILICVLPGFQVLVAWITTNFSIVSALLAFLAVQILFKPATQALTIGETGFRITLAIIFLIVALLIYQATPMLYWAALILPIAMSRAAEQKKWRRLLAFYIPVGLSAMALYFIFFRSILFPIFQKYYGYFPADSRVVFTEDWAAKINWLLNLFTSYIFNLWSIQARKWLSILVVAFISFAAIFELIHGFFKLQVKNSRINLVTSLIERNLIIAGLFLLSILPILIGKYDHPCYRICIAISAGLVILVYVIFSRTFNLLQPKFKKIKTILLAIAVGVTSFSAHYNLLNYFALPGYIEIQHMENTINKNFSEKIRHIHVLRPSYSLADTKSDEFGLFSSCPAHNIGSMVRASLRDLKLPESQIVAVTSSVTPNKYLFFEGESLLVDMRLAANRIAHIRRTKERLDWPCPV